MPIYASCCWSMCLLFALQHQLKAVALLMDTSTLPAASHWKIPPTVVVWYHLRTVTVMHGAWSKKTVVVMLTIFRIFNLVFQVREPVTQKNT